MLENTTEPRHVQPGGRQPRVITDLVTIKATSADTGDASTLFETEAPLEGGAPPHMHSYEDESFYVLEGSYTFLIDGQQIELSPGGYAFAPCGTLHAFANPRSAQARMLVLATPVGILERFLEDVGVLLVDRNGSRA